MLYATVLWLEAGHVAQNMWLVAQALGLGAVGVGGFWDAEVAAVLETPEQEWAALSPVYRFTRSLRRNLVMMVLVCGTQYGASYLQALRANENGLRLGGILSRGSARSLTYAQQLCVPHYQRVEDIPHGAVDLACVAVSGEAGKQLILALLARGIHVLAEHPRDPDQVTAMHAAAAAGGAICHINGHFGDLQPARAFIAQVHNAGKAPLHVAASCNPRTLYSLIDILIRACPELGAAQIDPPEPTRDAFLVLAARTDGTSLSLTCQTSVSAVDDGSATPINHRICFIYPHGNLMLSESFGPLIWFPMLGAPENAMAPPFSLLTPLPQSGSHIWCNEVRERANRLALARIANHIVSGIVSVEQTTAHQLRVSNMWLKLTHCLGQLTVI